jgi:hypothetical protein
MAKLILLGGPTGVGKTTALRLLQQRIPRAAVLDADDVWRISEDLAVEGTREIAIANVNSVMRGYFEAGCDIGVLSWIFARPLLYEPVIAGLKDQVDIVQQIYLISSTERLRERLDMRGDGNRFEYSKSRLALIEALPFQKIDTTNLSPDEVADQVIALIGHR